MLLCPCASVYRVCCCVHEWYEYVCAHVNLCACLTVNVCVFYLGTYVYLLYMFVNSEGS